MIKVESKIWVPTLLLDVREGKSKLRYPSCPSVLQCGKTASCIIALIFANMFASGDSFNKIFIVGLKSKSTIVVAKNVTRSVPLSALNSGHGVLVSFGSHRKVLSCISCEGSKTTHGKVVNFLLHQPTSPIFTENIRPKDHVRHTPAVRRKSCSILYFWTYSHSYCNVQKQVCVPAPAGFEHNERKYIIGVLCDALRMVFSACVCPNKNLTRMLFHLTTRGGVQLQ